MEYGDKIKLNSADGIITRRVVKIHPTHVDVCTETEWAGYRKRTVGFPLSDVITDEDKK